MLSWQFCAFSLLLLECKNAAGPEAKSLRENFPLLHPSPFQVDETLQTSFQLVNEMVWRESIIEANQLIQRNGVGMSKGLETAVIQTCTFTVGNCIFLVLLLSHSLTGCPLPTLTSRGQLGGSSGRSWFSLGRGGRGGDRRERGR